MSYSDEVLADSPLVYWRLNSVSAVTDSSGNARDGAWTGAGKTLVPGLIADGDDAVSLTSAFAHLTPYAAWMNPAEFTLECWIKTSSTGLRAMWDRDTQTGTRGWQFRLNGGAIEFIKIAGGISTVSRGSGLNDGNIHHIAATYGSGVLKIYVDGAQVGADAALEAMTATSTPALGTNSAATGGTGFFNGVLDEAAYYGAALSPARVAAHYTAGITAPEGPTGTAVKHWDGTDLVDATITGYWDGTSIQDVAATHWWDGAALVEM